MKMVLEFLGVIIILNLLRTSYTEETVIVTNTTCNKVYDLAVYEKITLEYKRNLKNYDPRPDCMLTFRNNNTEYEICARTKLEGNDLDVWQAKIECRHRLRFYLKEEDEFHSYNGYTCSDIHYRPVCTKKQTVYAVYFGSALLTMNNINVMIYRRNITEAEILSRTTTTTTRRTTTTYRNDGNFMDSSDQHSIVSGVSTTIGIAIMIGACFLCCCALCHKCATGRAHESRNVQQMQELNGQPPGSSRPQSNNTSTPVVRTYMQVTTFIEERSHTQNAPSYHSVVRNERLTSLSVDDRNGHEQTTPTSLNIHENDSNSLHEPSPSPEEENSSIPETPPPAYCDIDPPPYPGV
ncbi:hypothetical protein ACF0H5_005374 [Mactra antiquata]